MIKPIAPERAWLAARLRALRMILGYSQQDLARRSETHADTIRRLEQGDFSPSTATLTRLARGLGVGRAFLAGNEGSPADEIATLVAVLRGKSPDVVRLAVRVAIAVVSECETMAIESCGVGSDGCDEHH
jgi:transcriptional regulator with XRE-family HTH domain